MRRIASVKKKKARASTCVLNHQIVNNGHCMGAGGAEQAALLYVLYRVSYNEMLGMSFSLAIYILG